MPQHNEVAAPVRNYSRLDFTALRYRFNKIPLSVIRDRLYTEDVLEERGIASDGQLERWLDDLRDNLIERARKANPLISKNLEDARTFNSWPAGTINFLVLAGEKSQAAPQLDDSLGVWIRPRVSKVLATDGIVTISDLVRCIERRGNGWYRPIPRIGQGKALALESWLRKNATSLGTFKKPLDVEVVGQCELGFSPTPQLLPFERISRVASQLDGSRGQNRATAFCLIGADNDLEAIQSYLYKFRGRDKTLRAYRKELERFLLWCVGLRRCALSSVLTDDCEAYKDFLAAPDHAWIGAKAPRTSSRWRPFERVLSPESQRYAVGLLRAFFDWLVKVRYLGGNPWTTVSDPLVVARESAMQIEKALPAVLWDRLIGPGGILAKAVDSAMTQPDAKQYLLARTAVELMGATGIRREEAANAIRGKLAPIEEPKGLKLHDPLWELGVLGKRSRWRSVVLPGYIVELIKQHWTDRGHDFDDPRNAEMALISPVVVPSTPTARAKHISGECSASLTGNGFSADGLYTVVKTALLRLSSDENVDLDDGERTLLRRAAPHALRHTFATQATANDVPLDVVQSVMGHVSQRTTAIYVRAERTRRVAELGKYFKTRVS
ncbi:phage integrase family protein [Pigmentiphaga kullae]|uniref:Site-specific recombinase XerD n=1 Tax=Pigmentiphaga kullae TaxID=151784 RepID=A0A4Q7NHG9_9BURK|nr:phage integrase family protein [Pigmentiphaga kullae]RZS84268.1 site-specific recombinase XerD [Pigmentiphaga kullae]